VSGSERMKMQTGVSSDDANGMVDGGECQDFGPVSAAPKSHRRYLHT
jgi:hypothetical protein